MMQANVIRHDSKSLAKILVSPSNGSAVTYISAKPYAAASIGIKGFSMLAIFFISTAKVRIIAEFSKFAVYILAFCFSPAPLPRYFERASLNFQLRLTRNVRRAGLAVDSSRMP